MIEELLHVDVPLLDTPSLEKLALPPGAGHPPRILILYGSLRLQSFSRKLALEAERILRKFGAETRVFDPHELPARALSTAAAVIEPVAEIPPVQMPHPQNACCTSGTC